MRALLMPQAASRRTSRSRSVRSSSSSSVLLLADALLRRTAPAPSWRWPDEGQARRRGRTARPSPPLRRERLSADTRLPPPPAERRRTGRRRTDVKMSTAVPGRTALIRSVASMPLITGIEMSRMATSGFSRSTRATASAPFAASPTTSMSAPARATGASPPGQRHGPPR